MPRLRKGEIAAGVRRRSEAANESAQARIRIFDQILAQRVDDPDVIDRFRTISALAGWRREQDKIVPMSQKTLRKHINEQFPGGYAAFVRASRSIRRRRGRGANVPLAETVSEQIAKASNRVAEMTNRYADLLQRMRRLTAKNSEASRELSRHLRVFGDAPPYLQVVK
jgi:hypothetical protein